MLDNASAWGHESILKFFDHHRMTTRDIYPSEWFFLEKKLVEGLSILDIGCAKGGMCNIISEHLHNFSYTGVDINQDMISAAKKRYPNYQFYKITETDYSILNQKQYDLVLCLGILHLHENWRNTIKIAWEHTKKTLILDLRETYLASIENKNISYFKMNFNLRSNEAPKYHLPYNIINVSEALQFIHSICKDALKVTHYGYMHPVSELAVTPISKVLADVYCIERSLS